MAYSRLRSQRGLALLIALMIVVIATSIAVSIIYEEKFTIRKTGHIYAIDRANVLTVGMEDFARVILREDQQDSTTDSLDEDWAKGVAGQPFEGGYFTGYLEDEQAKFNVNSIVISAVALNRFERLCDNLGVDKKIIPALMDWIDKDSDIRYPDGMEEIHETYRIANREMADISEMLLLHNIEPEMYEKLKPYITALPAPSDLNVNTMSAVVFESLGPNGETDKFTEERDNDPYDSVADFVDRLQFPVEEEGLSIGTKYFRAYGEVTLGEQVYNLSSLIYRDDKGNTTVLNRTLGRF